MENMQTFTVEGVGTFTFAVELPHSQFFMDRRRRMADLLGARHLIQMEHMVDEGVQPDADDMQKMLGARAYAEIERATNYILMKDHIKKYPDNVTLETLSPNDFGKVEKEFVSKLKFFRTPVQPTVEPVTPSTEPSNGQGQDSK